MEAPEVVILLIKMWTPISNVRKVKSQYGKFSNPLPSPLLDLNNYIFKCRRNEGVMGGLENVI